MIYRYLLFICIFSLNIVHAQPPGFVDEIISEEFHVPVGITFDKKGQAYVWEKGGLVYAVDKATGDKKGILDLREEVYDFLDHGLNGMTLHPDFDKNGYMYFLYTVDRNYLLNKDSANYNPKLNDLLAATIGRITRYTMKAGVVDTLSRKVILGDKITNGIPILMDNHGVGSLVFGTDTSLLVSVGDVALAKNPPFQLGDAFYYELVTVPIEDGIIDESQNIGPYRSQSLNSLNGKILRINPENGAGFNSNPFYDNTNPSSPASRIWSFGLRNPFRFSLKKGTGSTRVQDGNPGELYVGDVGWIHREEINKVTQGGENFGWPLHEGVSLTNDIFTDPKYTPQNHIPPIIEWRGDSPQVFVKGEAYSVGSPEFIGKTFSGVAAIGGIWLTTDHFKGYKDTYLVGDYEGWIKIFKFDVRGDPYEVVDIKEDIHPVSFAEDPTDGSVYYISSIFPETHQLRRLYSEENPNQPPFIDAFISPIYGNVPMNITFDGTKSFDPDGTTLSYKWDFGNGQFSDSPKSTFSYFDEGKKVINTSFTATDDKGKKSSKKFKIYLNNFPPEITSWSIKDINSFENEKGLKLDLDAEFTNHDPNEQLFFDWSIILHHEDHSHLITTLKGRENTYTLPPIPCDGQSYSYEIKLFIYDDTGLGNTISKRIKPQCEKEVDPVLGISLSPNPLNHLVNLEGLETYQNNEIQAQVFDINGRQVYQGIEKGKDLKDKINKALQEFSSGSYILKVQINNLEQSLRFIKY